MCFLATSTTANTLNLPVCYEQNQRYETKNTGYFSLKIFPKKYHGKCRVSKVRCSTSTSLLQVRAIPRVHSIVLFHYVQNILFSSPRNPCNPKPFPVNLMRIHNNHESLRFHLPNPLLYLVDIFITSGYHYHILSIILISACCL